LRKGERSIEHRVGGWRSAALEVGGKIRGQRTEDGGQNSGVKSYLTAAAGSLK